MRTVDYWSVGRRRVLLRFFDFGSVDLLATSRPVPENTSVLYGLTRASRVSASGLHRATTCTDRAPSSHAATKKKNASSVRGVFFEHKGIAARAQSLYGGAQRTLK